MSMLSSFLHPEDAYKSAQEESNKGWQQAQGYQKPFMQHGEEQYNPLNEARERLMNPGSLQNEWAEGYETSPYAKRLLNMNTGEGLDAASQMGLMGSSAALGNIQQGAADITARDRRDYLNDLMQKYMTGIGIGQNIYGVGAQTGANLGGQAIEHGNNIAGLKYGEKSAPGALFGKIAQGVGTAAANYFNPEDNAFGGSGANGYQSFNFNQ